MTVICVCLEENVLKCEIRYFKERGLFPLPKEASGDQGIPTFKGFVEIELYQFENCLIFIKCSSNTIFLV